MRVATASIALAAAFALAACASPEPRPEAPETQTQAQTSEEAAPSARRNEGPGAMHATCPMALPGTRVDLEKGEGIEVVLVFTNDDPAQRDALRQRVAQAGERMERDGVKLLAMEALGGEAGAGHGHAKAEGGTCGCGHHDAGTCSRCAHHQKTSAAEADAASPEARSEGEEAPAGATAHGSANPPLKVQAEVEDGEAGQVRLVLTTEEEVHAGYLVDEMQWRVMKMQQGECPMQAAAR